MADRLIGLQRDFLVLDVGPGSFDDRVVTRAATAIHRQPDASVQQGIGERVPRALAALMGAHDVGQRVARECFLECVNSVLCLQRDGDPVCEYFAIRSVRHRCESHEVTHRWNIRRAACPRLVGPLDLQAALQMRADTVLFVAAAGVWLALQRLRTHEPLCCGKRKLRMQFVDSSHQQLFDLSHRPRSGMREFGQRPLEFNRCQRHLGFERGKVRPPGSLGHLSGSFATTIAGPGPGQSICSAIRIGAAVSQSLSIYSKSVMYVTTFQCRKTSNG
ncbi:hypothetical protein OKW43_005892 [Paraburkholderia sp. WC7.3g]